MTISNILFKFQMWRAVQGLRWSCMFWELRGLPTCEVHGFHAQSWVTGKCYKCEENKMGKRITKRELVEKALKKKGLLLVKFNWDYSVIAMIGEQPYDKSFRTLKVIIEEWELDLHPKPTLWEKFTGIAIKQVARNIVDWKL